MKCLGSNLLLGNNAQFIRKPFADFIKTASDNDIKAAELTLQTPHFYVDSEKYHSIDEQKKLLKEAEIKVVALQPLPYRYSICANEGTIQYEKTLGYYKQCILMAKELNARFVCITGSGADYDKEKTDLLGNAKRTLRMLTGFAEEQDVVLLLGSVFGDECPNNASTPVLTSLGEIAEVIEEVNSKNLGAYLDTEVISVCGETIDQWFSLLHEKIALVRFTDGNYNGYRIWGEGCLPCAKYLDCLRRNGYAGALSLTISGERYISAPEKAFAKNIKALQNSMEV